MKRACIRAGFSSGVWALRLFEGYDWVTLLVVANLAFSGLLVSWVMKFADSILKARIPASACPCKQSLSSALLHAGAQQQLCVPVQNGASQQNAQRLYGSIACFHGCSDPHVLA